MAALRLSADVLSLKLTDQRPVLHSAAAAAAAAASHGPVRDSTTVSSEVTQKLLRFCQYFLRFT